MINGSKLFNIWTEPVSKGYIFDGKTEKFSTFLVCAFLSILLGWIKLTMSNVFLLVFFLKESTFSILLKYLLVDGRTGINPLTWESDSLI